jgi:zinc protease
MSLDWKKGPGYKEISNISLPPYELRKLSNGVDIYTLNQGSQEIIKFDIVFRGGRMLEHKKLVSKFTASLLREGTPGKNSVELANFFDLYGAALRVASNLDFVYLVTCFGRYIT